MTELKEGDIFWYNDMHKIEIRAHNKEKHEYLIKVLDMTPMYSFFRVHEVTLSDTYFHSELIKFVAESLLESDD